MPTNFAAARPPVIQLLFPRLFGLASDSSTAQNAHPDDARNRRDFVNEMLSRNAHAFSSEHDIASMMQIYPDRF